MTSPSSFTAEDAFMSTATLLSLFDERKTEPRVYEIIQYYADAYAKRSGFQSFDEIGKHYPAPATRKAEALDKWQTTRAFVPEFRFDMAKDVISIVLIAGETPERTRRRAETLRRIGIGDDMAAEALAASKGYLSGNESLLKQHPLSEVCASIAAKKSRIPVTPVPITDIHNAMTPNIDNSHKRPSFHIEQEREG